MTCCSEPGGAWCSTTTGASACATEAMSAGVTRCYLCKRTDYGDAYVLWVLSDGRLVEVCSICLDRAEADEPYCEHLDYTEDVA